MENVISEQWIIFLLLSFLAIICYIASLKLSVQYRSPWSALILLVLGIAAFYAALKIGFAEVDELITQRDADIVVCSECGKRIDTPYCGYCGVAVDSMDSSQD